MSWNSAAPRDDVTPPEEVYRNSRPEARRYERDLPDAIKELRKSSRHTSPQDKRLKTKHWVLARGTLRRTNRHERGSRPQASPHVTAGSRHRGGWLSPYGFTEPFVCQDNSPAFVSRIDSALYSNPSQLMDRRYNRGVENRHSLCTMTPSKNPVWQFLTEPFQRNCWDFSKWLQVAITTI